MSGAERTAVPALVVVSSIVGLWTLAVTQPLLDLLGRNAAFLVAHDATATDVVVLVAVLAVGVPLVVAGVVVGLRVVSRRASSWLHALVVAVLAGIVALVVLRFSGVAARLPAWTVLAAAAATGAAFSTWYADSTTLRVTVAATALLAPLVAGMFVFASPAGAIVLPEGGDTAAPAISGNPPPVVVVVFDELPVASLLGPDGTVMGDVFPSFARLAGDATFLRNTTAVHGQTSDALPAILTGRYPSTGALPIAADHPQNLFSLLAERYELHVSEPLTQLCPVGRCGDVSTAAAPRYASLLADLAVVAGHIVLPPELSDGLPSLEHGWRDFGEAAAADGKEHAVRDRFREARRSSPAADFERFVAEMGPAGTPTLDFIHVLLPHSPWRYLEDGTPYAGSEPAAGLHKGRWSSDPWPVAQGHQRHLIQTQLADRLLGLLLDRLEEHGRYDESLVVVLSDHGASFEPGTSLRVVSEATIDEITRVPLFVKAPGQQRGVVDDRPVEVTDVLPTVLDAVGAEPPDGLAGRSLFAVDADPRLARRFFGPAGPIVVSDDDVDIADVVERNHGWFADADIGAYPYRLAPLGRGQLLGAVVPAQVPTTDATWAPGGEGCVAESTSAAALLCGTLDVHPEPSQPDPILAIAVDGRVVAVTRALDEGAGQATFRTVLAPGARGSPLAVVQVLTVSADGGLAEVARRRP